MNHFEKVIPLRILNNKYEHDNVNRWISVETFFILKLFQLAWRYSFGRIQISITIWFSNYYPRNTQFSRNESNKVGYCECIIIHFIHEKSVLSPYFSQKIPTTVCSKSISMNFTALGSEGVLHRAVVIIKRALNNLRSEPDVYVAAKLFRNRLLSNEVVGMV